jgi:hypothetical protein
MRLVRVPVPLVARDQELLQTVAEYASLVVGLKQLLGEPGRCHGHLVGARSGSHVLYSEIARERKDFV